MNETMKVTLDNQSVSDDLIGIAKELANASNDLENQMSRFKV